MGQRGGQQHIVSLQVAVGLISGSSGLIADGIHSLSDLVADFLVLFVSAHSKAEADERHPYGHQRFENAASLALGLLLAGVGIGMLWSAISRSSTTRPSPRWRSPLCMWQGRADRQGTAVSLHAGRR
jgi:cation diffusion facilitator family transporter